MRIVILTYESLYSNLMTERLLKEFPGQVVGVVRSDCLIHGKSLPAGLFFLLRRTGLRFVGRKALELLGKHHGLFTDRIEQVQSRVDQMSPEDITANIDRILKKRARLAASAWSVVDVYLLAAANQDWMTKNNLVQ